jgi:DNA-binding response OmpR family regulator
VTVFGWISAEADPSPCWDLRRCGWSLSGAGCTRVDVLLVDARGPRPDRMLECACANVSLARMIAIGLESTEVRVKWLLRGLGEAVPAEISLPELNLRARRVADVLQMLPRRRRIGPLWLDLIHRDARRGPAWLNLHPREFELLWRLADSPGVAVSRCELLSQVWRISQERKPTASKCTSRGYGPSWRWQVARR